MGLTVKLIITHNTENDHIKTVVDSNGKYKRKATWEDVSAYSGHDVNSDLLRDWIYNYQKQNFPEELEKPNNRPFKCFIFDEPKKGFTLFKDYGWNPIKLEMKVAMAEVKKKCTKKVSFLTDKFVWEDMESTLKDCANQQVVSEVRKSKLMGHELATILQKSSSEVFSDFSDFDSPEYFITPTKKEPDMVDDETGADVWKTVQTLGELLKDKPLPAKPEAGTKHEVTAYQTTAKTRVYFKVTFTGEVSTDHKEPYDGRRFWNFPFKYLLQYNDIPKHAVVYEDVEFTFYTGFCVSDIEPGMLTLTVTDEDEVKYEIQAKPADTTDIIKEKVAEVTGVAPKRQVLKFEGKELVAETGGPNMLELGVKDGSAMTLEIFRIAITVKCPDGQVLSYKIEPIDTIETLKEMIQEATHIKQDKQILKIENNGDDKALSSGSAKKNGIVDGTVLILTEDFDPIVFVDIKTNTLFAVDRKVVIEKQALTPMNGNEEDFEETTKNKDARKKMLENMNECPNLGVNPNKVVEKTAVEQLGVQEKESVEKVFGVNLKTREQNAKGEELYFIDVRTGAAGELLRKKYINMNFITPFAAAENREGLRETEKDSFTYDKYVGYVRRAFGIEIVPRGV